MALRLDEYSTDSDAPENVEDEREDEFIDKWFSANSDLLKNDETSVTVQEEEERAPSPNILDSLLSSADDSTLKHRDDSQESSIEDESVLINAQSSSSSEDSGACMSSPTKQTHSSAEKDGLSSDLEEAKPNKPALLDSETTDSFGRVVEKRRVAWKKRSHANYGAVYSVMTGNLIPANFSQDGKHLASSQHVEYCRNLYTSDNSTADVEFPWLLRQNEDDEAFEFGGYYEPLTENHWSVHTNVGDLDELTTLDIQSNIAAALNSRAHLVWLIGIEDDGKVTGCELSEADIDIFCHAFDFSISTEFVPKLDTSLVGLRFIEVLGGDSEAADEDVKRYVIEITTTRLVATIYQLSSGRVFYNRDGKTVLARSVDQVHRELMKHKAAQIASGEVELMADGKVKMPITSRRFTDIVTGITVGVASTLLLGFGLKKMLGRG